LTRSATAAAGTSAGAPALRLQPLHQHSVGDLALGVAHVHRSLVAVFEAAWFGRPIGGEARRDVFDDADEGTEVY